MILFGETLQTSCQVEHFLAKERKTGSPVHEPLVGFNLVHGSFNGSLTPWKGESCPNCIIIPFNASDETLEFFDGALTRFLHPPIEALRPPSASASEGTIGANDAPALLLESSLEAVSGHFFLRE